jgi:hypothetical protein
MSISRCVEQPALYPRSAAPLPHSATPSSGHPPLPERPDFRLPERPDFRLPERPDSLLLGGLLERPVSPDDPTYATIGEYLCLRSSVSYGIEKDCLSRWIWLLRTCMVNGHWSVLGFTRGRAACFKITSNTIQASSQIHFNH